MARRSRQSAASPEERLAVLLRDALCAAWAQHNRTPEDDPAFAAVKYLGWAGYLHVAAQLIARGVHPPKETT